ncbi:hypothetical protein DAI22_10g176600 [Oryza sativa Japonica Group]|nr:hypothetical protein DAI22_10g176600 [Oryza sativa Japonica Group]
MEVIFHSNEISPLHATHFLCSFTTFCPRGWLIAYWCPRFTVIALKSLLPLTSSHSPPVITACQGSSTSYPGLHLHSRSVGRLEPLQQG